MRIDKKKLTVQLALVVSSASLLALSFPPLGWWPLVIPALAVLFSAIENTPPKTAFYLGMIHGVAVYGISLHWFFNIFGVASITFYALMALFIAIFCSLRTFFQRFNRSPFLNILFAALLWTAIEYYRCELFFLRFAWITPGSALGPTALSPLVGVYGASFLVATASASFLYRKTIPLAFVLTCSILALVLLRPAPLELEPDSSLLATVVQSEDCFIDPYLELSRAAKPHKPDLIVWPEHALPYDVRKNRQDFDLLKKLCTEMDSVLVLGCKTITGPTEFAGVGDRNWYNTALVINRDGVLGEYYKARPVHFFNDGIAGEEIEAIITPLGKIGTPICFDCDYTEIARKMAARGAELFAVPSYDAESWSITQHLQHSMFFRLRAAENARWIVCAASSGVSQIIDPHGHVRASIDAMKTGVASHAVELNTHKTFFTRHGWLFPWFAIISSIALFVHTMRRAMQQQAFHRSQRASCRPGKDSKTGISYSRGQDRMPRNEQDNA